MDREETHPFHRSPSRSDTVSLRHLKPSYDKVSTAKMQLASTKPEVRYNKLMKQANRLIMEEKSHGRWIRRAAEPKGCHATFSAG